MRLLFIGPPGAGKGTQAERVAERLGVPHISTGAMFRDHVSRGTDLGRKVEAIMAAGDYVPDEVTVAMLRERISDADARDGYILDGFPRTASQVEALDELLGGEGLDRVVVMEVDELELTNRLLARGRADDTKDTIHNRFEIYLDQTQPLIDVYSDRDLTVFVNGFGEVEQITQRILDALGHTPARRQS